MCFSATASFIVGGSLAVFGTVTLKLASDANNNRNTLPFAAIPLLFGVQQLVEGGLWFSIEHDMEQLKTITTYLFTMFSHMVWPAFVPFAVAMLERRQGLAAWRWRLMWSLRIIGLAVAFLLIGLVAMQPLMAVVDHHIIYVTPVFYDWPMMVFYVVATCFSCLLSTHRMVRLFGLLVLTFFFVSYWFYTAAFFSVWCFFAAILSMVIYIHFRGGDAVGRQWREGR